jgi:hypothetical protein
MGNEPCVLLQIFGGCFMLCGAGDGLKISLHFAQKGLKEMEHDYQELIS